MNVIFSGTAVGFGTSRYRYVRGLSDEAKAALKTGQALVVCPRPFNDRQGEWYVVTWHKGRAGHRLPTASELKAIEEARC